MRRPRRKALAAILFVTGLVMAATACAGPSPEVQATSAGTRIVRFELHSKLLGTTLQEIGVALPALASGAARPLLVLLHGRNGSPDQFLGLDLIPALSRAGTSAPDVILANGGADSYWHDRSAGPWGRSVVDELIPAGVRLLRADPSRIAIGGLSMGGFGALDIARLWPARFCAVGANSAAVWPTAGQTAAGAFDDAADFARHDLFGYARTAAHPYGRMPVWMDVGLSDGFHANDAALAGLLRNAGTRVTFHAWQGGHDGGYWSAHIDPYVSFYARSLAACH